MSRKTNKTSHVMDLLTNGASTESDATVNEAVTGQEKKAADIQSHTVTPAKVTVVDEGSRNDRLSQEILGKLTEELEEETRQELESQKAGNQEMEVQKEDTQESPQKLEIQEPEPQSTEEPAMLEETAIFESEAPSQAPQPEEPTEPLAEEVSPQVPEDISETVPPKEEDPSAVPVPDKKPQDISPKEPKEVKKTPKKEPHPIIPESQLDRRFQDKEYRFINVMEQLLMRQNLDSVLTQYEVCTCPRCMSDVCALALTGLPSKYVVTSKDSISPLISYYENKYKIPVLTELMKACNRVRQNPRHKVSSSQT